MSIASEFKEFAMKGNVVDLAVGVIIGAAFGKIVSSLVGDVIMPPLGEIIGGVNFSDMAAHLGKDPSGKDVLLKYGAFLQAIFDFLIIAFVLFMAIKGINRLGTCSRNAGDRSPKRGEVRETTHPPVLPLKWRPSTAGMRHCECAAIGRGRKSIRPRYPS